MGLAQMRIESVLLLINIIQTLFVQGGKKPYMQKEANKVFLKTVVCPW